MIFTLERASCLTGVPLAKLDRWLSTGVIRADCHSEWPRRLRWWLSEDDVVVLAIVRALRDRNVPMPKARAMAEHLQAAFGAEAAIDETARTWARSTGVDIAAIDAEIRLKIADRQNRVGMHGQITRNRRIQGGQWVFAGTRVPIWVVLEMHELGYDYEEIMRQYPGVTELDIDAALAWPERSTRRVRTSW